MKRPFTYAQQQGGVLLVTLVLMLLIVAMTLAAIKTAFLQEALAGNLRDREMAFQAAEFTLREAEIALASAHFPESGCAQGICTAQSAIDPVIDWSHTVWSTQAAALRNPPAPLISAPLYVIEYLPSATAAQSAMEGSGIDAASLNLLGESSVYRITANAWGMTRNAQVILQVTYLKK